MKKKKIILEKMLMWVYYKKIEDSHLNFLYVLIVIVIAGKVTWMITRLTKVLFHYCEVMIALRLSDLLNRYYKDKT